MEIIKFKILKYWGSKPINNRVKEIQLNLCLYLKPELNFKIDLSKDYDTNIFNFDIDIFGLLELNISKNKKQDHAGFWFRFSIFGLDFSYRKYDIRHWDYDNDCWEKYE